MSKVFVFGSRSDRTTLQLISALSQSGHLADVISPSDFRNWKKILWDRERKHLVITSEESEVAVPEVDCIFNRFRARAWKSNSEQYEFDTATAPITSFLQGSSGFVVNRPHAGWSNFSKPLHYRVLENYGFLVPQHFVTTERQVAEHHLKYNGTWISKGISSYRTTATVVDRSDMFRFDYLHFAPALFQRRVLGHEVRLHMIGLEAIAVSIASPEPDYREQARRSPRSVRMELIEAPEEIVAKCLNYCYDNELYFCGFDFVVEDNKWWCLEANPSPAFDFFESFGPFGITEKILKFLISTSKGQQYNMSKHVKSTSFEPFIEASRVQNLTF
ncbi:RimK family alpha-L-glutamate ligase [Acidisoma sp. S159]|uniref:ATP-grasp domain-containing protein n=1 Tax=Acidisoma sp. S159 TaxID=1747225 RepID=UPI00131B02B2|nr:hypothetical protein [Acidisoma sp. S159]